MPEKASSNGTTGEMVTRDYVTVLNMALDVLSTRVHALLGVLGALAIWGFTIYDPTQGRTYAALGFSITVLFPLVFLTWRKG